jgi:hypothetical protein
MRHMKRMTSKLWDGMVAQVFKDDTGQRHHGQACGALRALRWITQTGMALMHGIATEYARWLLHWHTFKSTFDEKDMIWGNRTRALFFFGALRRLLSIRSETALDPLSSASRLYQAIRYYWFFITRLGCLNILREVTIPI